MKLEFIILGLSLQVITFSSYSQESSIVPLINGNKWIYDVIYESSSNTLYGTQEKIVSYDTTTSLWACTCDSTYYFPLLLTWKIIIVKTYINNVIYHDNEYWFSDSSVFIKNSIYSATQRYVYSAYQLNDSTCFGFFDQDPDAEYAITLQQDTLWGNIIISQVHSVNWHRPTSPFIEVLETKCTDYFGPLYEYYGVFEFQGNWYMKIASLKGAIINGVLYGDTTTVSVNCNLDKPTRLSLNQNYPNPFNPSTKIKYSVNSTQKVTIIVYDLLGREIATLVNEEKPAGEYQVEFNTKSHSGEIRNLPSGIYFYQLRAGEYVETKKMVLLK